MHVCLLYRFVVECDPEATGSFTMRNRFVNAEWITWGKAVVNAGKIPPVYPSGFTERVSA